MNMNEGNTKYCPTTEADRQRHNGINAAQELYGGDTSVMTNYNNKGWTGIYFEKEEKPTNLVALTLWQSIGLGQNVSPGTEILVPTEHTAGGYSGYTRVDENTLINFAK